MKFVLHDRYPIEDLPENIRPSLPDGTHVRVLIEPGMSDEEALAELDCELAKGIKSLDEGRGIPIEEVEQRLLARFGASADAAE